MSGLYSELKNSFLNNKDKYVFENALTYQELLEQAEQINFNLKPNSVLMVEIDSGMHFVKTLIAAIRQKLIFAPIAPDSGDFIKAKNVLNPNAIYRDSLDLRHDEINPNLSELSSEGGFVRFTSGTTSNAKGVFISANSALERVCVAEKSFKLHSEDKVLFLMPMPYHFVTSILMMLKNAVTFTNDPEQATVSYGTPYHYQGLLEKKLPNLRLAISTSSHLPETICKQFNEKFGLEISQSYGIIEVGLPIGDFKKPKIGSVGKVLEGFEVKFLEGDENSGILAIKGPGIFDAYLEPFKKRSEVLKDSWFVTGDYAFRDKEGNIFIRGRKNSAIHLAGFKIFPEELEDVILSHTGVKEVQVISEPHQLYGSTIIAKVVCETKLEEKELRKFCKQKLGIIKTPKRFEFVDSLPKTSTGKILRKKEITIIGAGLSGCTVGVLLRKAGYNVTIYDYGKRPELVVGESLIPALIPIIQRMGLESEIEKFSVKKLGATIYLDSDIEWSMSFGNYKKDAYAYNVPRNLFDQSFKNLAQEVGCEIKNERAGVELLASNAFVIDASGRNRILANALNISSELGNRKDVALFAHFDRAELKHPGNLHMNVDLSGWFWRIPLGNSVSVGVVAPAEVLSQYGETSEKQFDVYISKALGSYLSNSSRISKVMKYQNYQLVNSSLVGSNWACVGDAAGFADPVFSSGVYLALSGAVNLADHIINKGFEDLLLYENFVKSELRNWKNVIESFYDGRFFSMIRYGNTLDSERLPEMKALVSQVMGGFADEKALKMYFSVLDFCHRQQECSNY